MRGEGLAIAGADCPLITSTRQVADGNNIQFTVQRGNKECRRKLKAFLRDQMTNQAFLNTLADRLRPCLQQRQRYSPKGRHILQTGCGVESRELLVVPQCSIARSTAFTFSSMVSGALRAAR